MKNDLFTALRLTIITAFLFGVAYPLLITGIAKIVAPNGGKGQEVLVNNQRVGFEHIGQKFDDPKYFNSRPSAVAYNAASTGGSNKGPTNPEYLALVEERISTFLKENPSIKKGDIPVDLITASGGGLDPHISLQAAEIQIPRIAKSRGINKDKLYALVKANTEAPLFGLLGPSRINVLKLNLSLDEFK
jgi:potassium-transporting ATPase KdpC subunit